MTTSIFKFMNVAHIRSFFFFGIALMYILKQVLWLLVNEGQEAGDV